MTEKNETGAEAAKPAAKPAGKPGLYKWKMRLDMYGVWALRIIVKGKVRDIMVKKIDFKGGGKKMKHGKHKHH